MPSLSDSSDVEGFVIVSSQECDGESSDTYTRLQQELIQQIKVGHVDGGEVGGGEGADIS